LIFRPYVHDTQRHTIARNGREHRMAADVIFAIAGEAAPQIPRPLLQLPLRTSVLHSRNHPARQLGIVLRHSLLNQRHRLFRSIALG
jgi:hypothetical protein